MFRQRGAVALETGSRTTLVAVAPDAWCVCDPTMPSNDARHLVAYIERDGDGVDVLWVREQRAACQYESLHDAVQSIEDSLDAFATGAPSSH